jgi:flavin reductase
MQSFRKLMSCFATGITIVTVHDKKLGPVGLTVNSLTSVSLKPPLVLFCLDKSAHLYPVLSRSTTFAVNILGEDQEDISRYFADYRRYQKPQNLWEPQSMPCPLLRHTLGWMICKKTVSYQGGDHTIFLGRVIKLHIRRARKNPLLYFHSRYQKLCR